MTDLYFHRPRGAVLKVGAEAVALLRRHEQHLPGDLEAGGLLVGRHVTASDAYLIDAVTEPQPQDERTRKGFYRHGPSHNAIMYAMCTDGVTGYLGNWHTHPEPHPTPSVIDLAAWHDVLEHDVVEDSIKALLFVIVGQRQIAVWEGDRRTGEISRLLERRAEAA